MSYLKQHLYLTKYIKRKMREAQMPDDSPQGDFGAASSTSSRSGPAAGDLAGKDFLAFLG